MHQNSLDMALSSSFVKKKYPKSTEKEISSRFVIIDEITNLDIGIEKEIISAVKRVVGQ